MTLEVEDILKLIINNLEEKKAFDIKTIDLTDQQAIVDYMVVASATSGRHATSLADYLSKVLRDHKIKTKIEGERGAEWILLDAGDILVHIFRPETRAAYNLEDLWEKLEGLSRKVID